MYYSTANRPASFDYYRSNKTSVNESYKPLSLSRNSESSSGIEINDDESMEVHSSESETLIIRYYSPSSSSPCRRTVIIKSNDHTETFTDKRRRRQRRKRRERYFNKSSNYHREYSQDRLKRLYEEYSSEQIHHKWKPLNAAESQELYQYALDKYHRKSYSN